MKKIFPRPFPSLTPFVIDRSGLEVNRLSRFTQPYTLVNDEIAGVSFAAVAANSSTEIAMSNGSDGVLELPLFRANATSNAYTVHIKHLTRNIFLMNRPIYSKNIFGTGGRPLKASYPLYIDLLQSLYVTLTDLSGATNNVRVALDGTKYKFADANKQLNDLSPINKMALPYWYTTDADVTLPASTVETIAYMTISQTEKFFLDAIRVQSTATFKFKVTDTTTGLSWSNGWVHSDFLNEAEYCIKKHPQLVEGKLKITMVNLTAGATNNVYFALSGVIYTG